MSSSDHHNESNVEGRSAEETKYKGVRRRKWGKWVSEIRVPGSQERLWLGTYAKAEAAAVAHDVASYCLRGPSCITSLNFPALMLQPDALTPSAGYNLSPKSIQKAASDAGMAVDAGIILTNVSQPSSSLSLPTQDSFMADAENRTASAITMNKFRDINSCWEGNATTSGDCNDQAPLNISVEDYL